MPGFVGAGTPLCRLLTPPGEAGGLFVLPEPELGVLFGVLVPPPFFEPLTGVLVGFSEPLPNLLLVVLVGVDLDGPDGGADVGLIGGAAGGLIGGTDGGRTVGGVSPATRVSSTKE